MMKICSPGRLSLAVLALVLVVIVVSLKTQSDQVTDRSGFSQNGFIPDEGKENKINAVTPSKADSSKGYATMTE